MATLSDATTVLEATGHISDTIINNSGNNDDEASDMLMIDTTTTIVTSRNLYSSFKKGDHGSNNDEYSNIHHADDNNDDEDGNGVGLARAIFVFYVSLLMFAGCLCSFLLMWKTPQHSESDNQNDNDLDISDEQFYGFFGNIEEALDVARRRNDESAAESSNQDDHEQTLHNVRQQVFDRTVLLRKKLQILLYIRYNHVEMVSRKKVDGSSVCPQIGISLSFICTTPLDLVEHNRV